MADTIRTLSALQTLLADNTAGDISAQDARDVLVSVYGGGLNANAQTVTTADITGAVGQLYVCTIAGLTANRNLTLPSASAGEKVGVYIVDGDDAFTLILKGAASQTINGGSAATEWSRLFIAGEVVIFTCTAANTWIVERDGRRRCNSKMYLAANITTNTAGEVKLIAYDTSDYSLGIANTTGASARHTIRRAGNYICFIGAGPASAPTDGQYYGIGIYKNGSGTQVGQYNIRLAASSNTHRINTSAQLSLAVDDYLEGRFFAEEANKGCLLGQAITVMTTIEVF